MGSDPIDFAAPRRPADDSSRHRTGMTAISDDLHAVDEQLLDATRELMWPLVRAVILDSGWIEHHDIGVHPDPQ